MSHSVNNSTKKIWKFWLKFKCIRQIIYRKLVEKCWTAITFRGTQDSWNGMFKISLPFSLTFLIILIFPVVRELRELTMVNGVLARFLFASLFICKKVFYIIQHSLIYF